MMCPKCQIAYNEERWNGCPHCGANRVTHPSGVVKSSTILIAAGNGKSGIYRSLEEVPAILRETLVKSVNSLNSGTIIIADQRGRQEIAKAIRNLPQNSAPMKTETLLSPPMAKGFWSVRSGAIFGLLLATFIGAVVWLVLAHTW